MAFPKWMSLKDNAVTVKPEGYYPEFLSELGSSPDTADQLDMEVAYRFMQWTVKLMLAVEKKDPRVGDNPISLTINVLGTAKDKWAHKLFPEGKAKGMEWRDQLRYAADKWKQCKNMAVPS